MPKISVSKTFVYIGISVIVLVFVLIFIFTSCSNKKDLGGGFKSIKTEQTLSTIPSETANISQPCSFLSLKTAASILGTTEKKLGDLESSKPSDGTLRCRYAAISDDKKLFLVLNVYIYEKQSAFDLVKKANKGKTIETSVDEGFYFDKTNNIQSERLVAARDNENRIAISSSIAIVDPKDQLQVQQIILPEVSLLANQLGLMLSKVQ